MSKEIKRLGRGLASLVAPMEQQPTQEARTITPPIAPIDQQQHHRLASLRVDQIRPNPMQPRRSFDDGALASLAASIKSRGALQPVVVRPAEGGYELVAGERRLRAAAIAGLETIPAIVRGVRDEDLLELALIENIHRADLNAVDRAKAYRTMQDRYGLSHEAIGERMGEDRATVSNYIRILELGEDILTLVASGDLGIGHAKALLGSKDPNIRRRLAQQCCREGWSVRQVETAISGKRSSGAKPPAVSSSDARPTVRDMEERLTKVLARRVTIKEGRKRHTGRLTLEYYGLEDFDRLVALLGVSQESA
ncbi:MAG TPA: ParB/RepB/Spo0J family partition protein [Phycisphaerae bacterium]|nr:ParB/RepB/Spo0J family partition protein [Phycisphaerae bacterium]